MLDRLKAQMHALAPHEGHTTTHDPDLCLYRFHAPTRVVKAASFGVTLGVVAQGAKRVRVGASELVVDPTQMLALTRETEHASMVVEASAARPYLGLALCFSPERVARALVALAEAGGPRERETSDAFVMPLDDGILDALSRLLRTLDDPLDRKV